MGLLKDLWNKATYRSAPVRDVLPPRRPRPAHARVEVGELELVMLEVDRRTGLVRVAAVRRPT